MNPGRHAPDQARPRAEEAVVVAPAREGRDARPHEPGEGARARRSGRRRRRPATPARSPYAARPYAAAVAGGAAAAVAPPAWLRLRVGGDVRSGLAVVAVIVGTRVCRQRAGREQDSDPLSVADAPVPRAHVRNQERRGRRRTSARRAGPAARCHQATRSAPAGRHRRRTRVGFRSVARVSARYTMA